MVSECLSVANLQDRINQMEETHYSTSEELQATLQELNELHEQVNRLRDVNCQLELDRSYLIDTLVSQTKKLEGSLAKSEQVTVLLISQYSDEERLKELGASGRERELVALLKTVEAEKEELEARRAELVTALEEMRSKFDQERFDLIEKFR